jgi:hypothetical protein
MSKSAHASEESLTGLARKVLLCRPIDTPCLRIGGRWGSFTWAGVVHDDASLARRIVKGVTLG